jgi:hypothetical protein
MSTPEDRAEEPGCPDLKEAMFHDLDSLVRWHAAHPESCRGNAQVWCHWEGVLLVGLGCRAFGYLRLSESSELEGLRRLCEKPRRLSAFAAEMAALTGPIDAMALAIRAVDAARDNLDRPLAFVAREKIFLPPFSGEPFAMPAEPVGVTLCCVVRPREGEVLVHVPEAAWAAARAAAAVQAWRAVEWAFAQARRPARAYCGLAWVPDDGEEPGHFEPARSLLTRRSLRSLESGEGSAESEEEFKAPWSASSPSPLRAPRSSERSERHERSERPGPQEAADAPW